MASVRLRCISPHAPVDVELLRGLLPARTDDDGQPLGATTLRAGEEFDVPGDLAGRAPGVWREPTDLELEPGGLAGLVTRGGDDSADLEVLCTGAGLLAMTDAFELAAPLAPSKSAAAAAAPAAQEG